MAALYEGYAWFLEYICFLLIARPYCYNNYLFWFQRRHREKTPFLPALLNAVFAFHARQSYLDPSHCGLVLMGHQTSILWMREQIRVITQVSRARQIWCRNVLNTGYLQVRRSMVATVNIYRYSWGSNLKLDLRFWWLRRESWRGWRYCIVVFCSYY